MSVCIVEMFQMQSGAVFGAALTCQQDVNNAVVLGIMMYESSKHSMLQGGNKP